jgi:hypothetical protein
VISLRVVGTVLGGVPGTYRAARAVAGHRVAAGVLAASGWSLLVALVNTGARPRLRNAVRHFTWSAWLAARYGDAVARAVTEEHELHSLDLRDSEADERNNRAGRRYGAVHRAEILQRPAPVAIWRLAAAGRRRWHAGRLWSVRDGVVVAGSRRPARRTH